MIPKTWGKDFCCSKFSVERRTSEQPSPIHPAVLLPDIYFSRSEAAFHMIHHPSRSLGSEAKRSRVESIIKGMSGSSGVSNANPQEVRQGDTSMTLSLYENQMGQLEMYQPLDQYQVCVQNEGKNEDTNNKTVEETLRRTSQKLSRDLYCDDFMFHNGKPLNYMKLKADKVKLMKDVLKCELSKALSTSVDTIFKTKTKQETREPPSHHFYFSDHRTSARPIPGTQTEAMSLVVRNDKLHPLSPPKHGDGHERPKPHRGRGPEKGPQQTADWASGAFKVKSKVNSGEERRPYPVGHEVLKSLPLTRVRQSQGESSSFNDIYTINEGLTTNHLKKAKLMFFYTRYPSSFVLKMCFGDVQFTRCITSQLIKWFSNFREFFYIQMEKFARHAVLRGAAGDGALAVGRESELFRVLNLHYNKTSDFQVPDRFLEVAEVTLREFYIAICLGRDQDPSWKKGIYRVISKLDSDVPTDFILT